MQVEVVNINEVAQVVELASESDDEKPVVTLPPVTDEAALWPEDYRQRVRPMQAGFKIRYLDDQGPNRNMGPIFQHSVDDYRLGLTWDPDADLRRALRSHKALHELHLNQLVFDLHYAGDDGEPAVDETLVHDTLQANRVEVPIWRFTQPRDPRCTPLMLQSIEVWLGTGQLYMLPGIGQLSDAVVRMMAAVRELELQRRELFIIDMTGGGAGGEEEVAMDVQQDEPYSPTDYDGGVEEMKNGDGGESGDEDRGQDSGGGAGSDGARDGERGGESGGQAPVPMDQDEEPLWPSTRMTTRGTASQPLLPVAGDDEQRRNGGRDLRPRAPTDYSSGLPERRRGGKGGKRKRGGLSEELDGERSETGTEDDEDDEEGSEWEQDEDEEVWSESEDEEDEKADSDEDYHPDDDDEEEDADDVMDDEEDEVPLDEPLGEAPGGNGADEEEKGGEAADEDQPAPREQGERPNFSRATVRGGEGQVHEGEHSTVTIQTINGQRVPGIRTVVLPQPVTPEHGGGGASSASSSVTPAVPVAPRKRSQQLRIKLEGPLRQLFHRKLADIEAVLVEHRVPELSAHVLAASAALLCVNNERHRTPQELMQAYLRLDGVPRADEVRDLLLQPDRLNAIFANYREDADPALPQLNARTEQVLPHPGETRVMYRLPEDWRRGHLGDLQPETKPRRGRRAN